MQRSGCGSYVHTIFPTATHRPSQYISFFFFKSLQLRMVLFSNLFILIQGSYVFQQEKCVFLQKLLKIQIYFPGEAVETETELKAVNVGIHQVPKVPTLNQY